MSSTAPTPRPKPPSAVETQQSSASLAIERHFTSVEQQLLRQGLLRQDGGGAGARFSARDLTENFIRIALYDEYVFNGNTLTARETRSALRRWERPVRFQITFGDRTPPAQRSLDRRSVARYAKRLADATGHPISLGGGQPNFHILILDEDERRSFQGRLAEIEPKLSAGDVRSILTMPRSTLCHVFAFSGRTGANVYDTAVAVIRSEHPDLMRLSCIHEELAQGLGLANDSRGARPSIFNDDEEFALLTRHDELLLRILYDPRLAPGMTEAEARPIVRRIAEELINAEEATLTVGSS